MPRIATRLVAAARAELEARVSVGFVRSGARELFPQPGGSALGERFAIEAKLERPCAAKPASIVASVASCSRRLRFDSTAGPLHTGLLEGVAEAPRDGVSMSVARHQAFVVFVS